jgi:hypothetical protein
MTPPFRKLSQSSDAAILWSNERVELAEDATNELGYPSKCRYDWPVTWKAYYRSDCALHAHLRLIPRIRDSHGHHYCVEFQWLRDHRHPHRVPIRPLGVGGVGKGFSGEVVVGRGQKYGCQVLVLVPVGQLLQESELRDVFATPAICAAYSLVWLKLLEDCPMEPLEVRANLGISELARLVIDREDDLVGVLGVSTSVVNERKPPSQVIEGRPEVVNAIPDDERPPHSRRGMECGHPQQIATSLRPGLGHNSNSVFLIGEGLKDLVVQEIAMFLAPSPLLPPAVPRSGHDA